MNPSTDFQSTFDKCFYIFSYIHLKLSLWDFEFLLKMLYIIAVKYLLYIVVNLFWSTEGLPPAPVSVFPTYSAGVYELLKSNAAALEKD